jgi:hypothetical protein
MSTLYVDFIERDTRPLVPGDPVVELRAPPPHEFKPGSQEGSPLAGWSYLGKAKTPYGVCAVWTRPGEFVATLGKAIPKAGVPTQTTLEQALRACHATQYASDPVESRRSVFSRHSKRAPTRAA